MTMFLKYRYTKMPLTKCFKMSSTQTTRLIKKVKGINMTFNYNDVINQL